MCESHKSKIELNSYFPFDIFNQHLLKGFNMEGKFHWHECLEISWVKSGKGRYYIEDRAYDMRVGDIIIINNIEPHYLEVFEEMHQQVIVFEPSLVVSGREMMLDYDYLNPFFERGTDFNNRLDRKNPLYVHIMQNILELEDEYNCKPEGYMLMIRAKLLNILTYLIRYFRDNRRVDYNRRLNMKRVGEVMEYVKVNFHETITLEQAAQRVFLSPQYFSAIFKNITGMNYIEYLNKVRVDHSIFLLSKTDMKVTQIAMECGFNNTVNFNTSFKKYTGKTPSTLRKEL